MIRAQRRAHRAIFAALGVVLPLFAWRALAARLPAARVDALPSALEAPSVQSLERAGDPLASTASATLIRTREGSLELELSLPAEWSAPDALAYWSSAAASDAGLPGDAGFPDDARLVGLVRGAGRWRASAHPELGLERGGVVVLYSLAHGAVVERLRVRAAEDLP